MKKLLFLTSLILAACGVDGEPIQPSGGVDVSVTASGVGMGANVGLAKGPLRVGLGL